MRRGCAKGEIERSQLSRYGNPTVTTFQDRLAVIERGEACFATANGMAALYVSLACLLKQGSPLVAEHVLSISSLTVFNNCFSAWGLTVDYVDLQGEEAMAVAFRFLAALVIIKISNNLGDAKSIVTHSGTTTHHKFGAEGRAAVGMFEATAPLAVGPEDVEDLREDLGKALAAI